MAVALPNTRLPNLVIDYIYYFLQCLVHFWLEVHYLRLAASSLSSGEERNNDATNDATSVSSKDISNDVTSENDATSDDGVFHTQQNTNCDEIKSCSSSINNENDISNNNLNGEYLHACEPSKDIFFFFYLFYILHFVKFYICYVN